MTSFNLALPKGIKTIGLEKFKTSSATFPDAYQDGFTAGYQAGQWKAALEAQQQRELLAQQGQAVLQKMEKLHQELYSIVSQHLPQLLLAALSRVLQHHRFTDEELVREVQTLVKELAQADQISIECSPVDLALLKERVDGIGVSWTQGQLLWKENPLLQQGEFILQSDLGTVDGRRIAKINQVMLAIEAASQAHYGSSLHL